LTVTEGDEVMVVMEKGKIVRSSASTKCAIPVGTTMGVQVRDA
jgi:hypothetical protein